MIIEKRLLSELHPASYNPRVDLKPKDKEYQAIKNSIESFGNIEPIIWNKRTGNIVGGHQRYKILKEQGVTETEVVVVDFDETKEKAANLALNKAVGLWDEEAVDKLLAELKDTEYNMEDYNFETKDISLEPPVSKYTMNAKAPVYEMTGDNPSLLELYDVRKTQELISKIKAANISEEEKAFLTIAAYRHCIFDYGKIAEYYAHANKELQELMEDSALVIIDYDSAIEKGFVYLSKTLEDMYGQLEQ